MTAPVRDDGGFAAAVYKAPGTAPLLGRPAVRRRWLGAVVGITAVPPLISIALMALHGDPPGLILSVSLGVLSLAAFASVVLLPSRVRRLTIAIGVERVLELHKVMAFVAFGAVVLHTLVATLRHHDLVNPFTLTPASVFAWLSVGALLTLLSQTPKIKRKGQGRHYERWMKLHLVLVGVTLGGGFLHVLLLPHSVGRWGLLVADAVLALTLLHRWVWQPLTEQRNAYLIYGTRDESQSAVTLILQPRYPHWGGLRFSPGQFIWVRLKKGRVGTEEHPYSIASSALVRNRLEVTVNVDGDFSRRITSLPVGTPVWLDGPHGNFTYEGMEYEGLVLLCAGVGVTPMISMLRTLADAAARGAPPSPQPHRIVMAQREGQELFKQELLQLRNRNKFRLGITFTNGARMNAELMSRVLPPDTARRDRLLYFICAAPAFLEASVAALRELDIPEERIYTERF